MAQQRLQRATVQPTLPCHLHPVTLPTSPTGTHCAAQQRKTVHRQTPPYPASLSPSCHRYPYRSVVQVTVRTSTGCTARQRAVVRPQGPHLTLPRHVHPVTCSLVPLTVGNGTLRVPTGTHCTAQQRLQCATVQPNLPCRLHPVTGSFTGW